MSYAKAMKFNKRRNKAIQPCLFSTIEKDERRRYPWLGSWAVDPANAEKVKAYVEEWEKETERMLKENPNLKIIDR